MLALFGATRRDCDLDHHLSIAQEALTHYSLTCKSIDFISQSANAIYKITDLEDNSYSLRLPISKSENLESFWTSPEALQAEMVWLHALAMDTDLTLPAPVKNIHGEFLTPVNQINCTLVRWVEGEQKPFIALIEEAISIGVMMGKLHKQAANWTIPSPFARPAFDGSRVKQSLDKLKVQTDAGLLNRAEFEVLEAAGLRAIAMMNAMPVSSRTQGIIHADLIPSNIVFHEKEARPIDFGACCFGFFLADLGWTFSYIHPFYREALLEAYSHHYDLPDHHMELLEGFFVAGQLETMHFWLGLPDWQEWLPDHIAKLTQREFKRYVNHEPFLFTGTPYWE